MCCKMKGLTLKRGRQAWKWLAGICAAFWVIFAFILIVSDIPFFVVSFALTTIAVLSLLVIALAWAYTHDY
jgi:flagellar biosynthesis component FlhA